MITYFKWKASLLITKCHHRTGTALHSNGTQHVEMLLRVVSRHSQSAGDENVVIATKLLPPKLLIPSTVRNTGSNFELNDFEPHYLSGQGTLQDLWPACQLRGLLSSYLGLF